MDLWLTIAVAGFGTFMMRSAGAWTTADRFNARWLSYLPLAVMLVMAVDGLARLRTPLSGYLPAAAAAAGVLLVSLLRTPLVLRVALGCIVFGLLSVR